MATQISEAESQIMEALWRKTPLTAEQIIDKVGKANGWAPGTVRTASYEATVSMRGVDAAIPAELRVIKVDADTVLVQTAKPLLVAASAVGLAEAVEELRTVANLPSINPQVVVDFSLAFNSSP